MAEFTIKTYNESIHNIYLKGDVDEEMWQTLVDKISEIRAADDDIDYQNSASLACIGLNVQGVRPPINIYIYRHMEVVFMICSQYMMKLGLCKRNM